MIQAYEDWLRNSVGRWAYHDERDKAAGNKAHLFSGSTPRGPYRFEESLCHLAGDIMAGEGVPSLAGDPNRCRHCERIGERLAKTRLLHQIFLNGNVRPGVARA